MPQSILNMADGPAKWSAMMAYNRKWILNHLKNGSTIVDIGIDINVLLNLEEAFIIKWNEI